jgi:hypothetical protein
MQAWLVRAFGERRFIARATMSLQDPLEYSARVQQVVPFAFLAPLRVDAVFGSWLRPGRFGRCRPRDRFRLELPLQNRSGVGFRRRLGPACK